jgi:hypothetical protein
MTNLGLKIREPKRDSAGNLSGKLDAKVLINELPVLELKGHNSGTANEWTKFSFNLEQNDRTLTEILQSFSQEGPGPIVKGHHFWVRLDKSRILLKYEPAQNKVFAVDMNIAEGCGIELTAIRINGARYYSFGLESFSESGQQRKNFYATLEFLFSEINITSLSIANSLSYPQFLAANPK